MTDWWALMAERGTRTDPDRAAAACVAGGTPNRNRITLQMVKDVLDESTFEASPGHVVPGPVGKALSGLAGRLRDRADGEHPG